MATGDRAGSTERREREGAGTKLSQREEEGGRGGDEGDVFRPPGEELPRGRRSREEIAEQIRCMVMDEVEHLLGLDKQDLRRIE